MWSEILQPNIMSPRGFAREKFSRKIFRIVRGEEPLLSPLLCSPILSFTSTISLRPLHFILVEHEFRGTSLFSVSPSTLFSPFLQLFPIRSRRHEIQPCSSDKDGNRRRNDGKEERVQKRRSLPFVRGAACARARAAKALKRPSVSRVFCEYCRKSIASFQALHILYIVYNNFRKTYRELL